MDGDLRLHHDGLGNINIQRSQDIPSPTKSATGDSGVNTPSERNIGPELFTDVGTPEISFGRDVELPPTGCEDEGNKIS